MLDIRFRIAALFVICCLVQTTATAQDKNSEVYDLDRQWVGGSIEDAIVTPVNQRLTPVGKWLDLPGMRPQVLALSPNGKIAVTSGKTSKLLVIDPETATVLQQVDLPSEESTSTTDQAAANNLKPDTKAIASFTGLVFSPDGRSIYLSNVQGSIKVFSVDATDKVSPSHVIRIPDANAPQRKQEIPSGLAISPDGKRLFVCGNLSNRMLEIDIETSKVTRTFDVGVAPYDVKLAGNKAIVSNWGGRRPGHGDLVGPAGKGTKVRVDPVRFIANEGSVSMIDLESGSTQEILVGLHPSGLVVSPDGKYVVCANAASDYLSVIDLGSSSVIEKIWTKSNPSELFGASPNALVFGEESDELYVANGTQNAIAVIEFEPQERGESKLKGMIPVGWFPGALVYDPNRRNILVANIKGLPSEPKKQGNSKGFNSHQYQGSISIVPVPKKEDLPVLSERVARNMRAEALIQSRLPARQGEPARAIPQRVGEPSLIEHVVYIIKENRTYDQVFGDVGRGNSDPELCIFGKEITPNQHKLVEEFVLLDNTYCCGILSADGHQWSTTAMATDYLEKSFAGFPRSYPDGMEESDIDALAYSPAGFIWDNAVKHGIRIRNYGEFMMPKVRWKDKNRGGAVDFLSCYKTWKGIEDLVVFESTPGIESIKDFSPTGYVGWNMSVPDQVRADFILKELAEFEKQGSYPQLTIICLPNDHTSGTSKNCPTPAACMADGDLAMGRIVEGLSRSKFWGKMAIFAIEDDPQAGWDHVSGYRTTAYVMSPYAKRGALVSTQYNTTSILRTIQQILGMPPMNQFDGSATPMFDCFQDTPDLRSFESVPANIPLDQMNPGSVAITDPLLKQLAEWSEEMNFEQVDRAPEDRLNRVLWHAMRGSNAPYPEWAVGVEEEEDEE
ncbi:MAG: bifunctional YncE family protein/alkaline phosphatase family protein [Planctomycetota bacterium]|jgi:YVTN family beta-propeller protein